jgi:hypothetical protein
MKKRNITLPLVLGFAAIVFWWMFGKSEIRDMAVQLEDAPYAGRSPNDLKHKIIKIGTEAGDAVVVEYSESPKAPLFNAPCPIDPRVEKEVLIRTLPLGFNKEADKRNWADIVAVIEGDRSLLNIKQKLRDFLVLYMKLQSPHINKLLGTSESVDLLEFTKTAICDEVALAHHRIKNGIDPLLGADFTNHQTLEPQKPDRILFETMYKSCRMASSNSFRYPQGGFTRVSFAPSESDWVAIKKAFELDEKGPSEIVCTYKPKE